MLTAKQTVQRLVTEVINGGDLDLIDALFAPALSAEARDWIGAFRASFPDVHMEIIELIAEPTPGDTGDTGDTGDAGDTGDIGQVTVVGRFTCSGTHTAQWCGHPPTGRRFERIDEVGIYRVADGRIVHSWTLEDTLTRLRHLGLTDDEHA